MEGDLGRCLSQFDSIFVHIRTDISLVEKADNWISVSSVDLAYKIIMRMGEKLEAIHVHYNRWLGREFQEHEMFSSISEKCPNIESVRPLSVPWPREIVQRLKNVKLDSNACAQIIVDIPLFCTGIRQLSCNYLDVSYLKQANIWEKVGNALEILTHGRRNPYGLVKMPFFLRRSA